jgi:uncharacterized protein (TIGR02646 family)
MISVKRNAAVPASLLAQQSLDQLQQARDYYEDWEAGDRAFVEFTRYKDYDVQQALRNDFSWKCAYCEKLLEKGLFEVEHYRPKGGVAGCDHPGYWWLALTWTNLLPTCAACNKGLHQHIVTGTTTLAEVEAMQTVKPSQLHGKATQFPVGAARLLAEVDDHGIEQPLLMDPTRTDPEPHLRWRHDGLLSVVEAADGPGGPSVLGAETINCVALNRLDLAENRTQILDRIRTQRIQIMEALEKDAGPGADAAEIAKAVEFARVRIEDMKASGLPNQPFAGMVRAFVRALTAELDQWVADQAA